MRQLSSRFVRFMFRRKEKPSDMNKFAHGKEELRPIPNRVRTKIKSDYVIVDPYYSPQSSTSSNNSKLAVDTMSTSSSAAKEAAISKFSKLEIQQKKNTPTSSPNVASIDWSPLDDGIIPSSTNEASSRKAVDDHINSVLYDAAQKKRLPVFFDICPE